MTFSRTANGLPVALLLACGAVLSACGGGSSAPAATQAPTRTSATSATTTAAPAPAAAPAAVTLKDIAFTPSTVTIVRGGSVRWTWKDGDTPHNVTFADRHSTTKKSGSYTLKFAKAGTFSYQCTIHPGMVAKVIVK